MNVNNSYIMQSVCATLSSSEVESTKQLVGIVDFANYVGQWINIQERLTPQQVLKFFCENQQLTSKQHAIISTLRIFDELHIVVKNQYALDAGCTHFQHWFNGRIFFHMSTSPTKLPFEKQKEMDDVTCIYLRELYIRRGYDAIVISNDQYRSFSQHTTTAFAFNITSWEQSDTLVDVTQKVIPFMFSEASPNLVKCDPKDCTFSKCPSFPNNSTKQDWIPIDKPRKWMLDVVDSTIDQFFDRYTSSSSSKQSLSESFDELMTPSLRQSLEKTLSESLDELMTNTLRQSLGQSLGQSLEESDEPMSPPLFNNMLYCALPMQS